MKLKLIIIIFSLLLIFFWVLRDRNNQKDIKDVDNTDYKNIEYVIDGHKIKLINGLAETKTEGDSYIKTITRYFGNDLKTDLNGDGKEDIVFLVTQNKNESETFFYAVSALKTENGYIGSDGYFLGKNIAPQTTNVSQNPRHKYVIVVNYAERRLDESTNTSSSIGRSAYLKLDEKTMQWGIVVPDFEGESR